MGGVEGKSVKLGIHSALFERQGSQKGFRREWKHQPFLIHLPLSYVSRKQFPRVGKLRNIHKISQQPVRDVCDS